MKTILIGTNDSFEEGEIFICGDGAQYIRVDDDIKAILLPSMKSEDKYTVFRIKH